MKFPSRWLKFAISFKGFGVGDGAKPPTATFAYIDEALYYEKPITTFIIALDKFGT